MIRLQRANRGTAELIVASQSYLCLKLVDQVNQIIHPFSKHDRTPFSLVPKHVGLLEAVFAGPSGEWKAYISIYYIL